MAVEIPLVAEVRDVQGSAASRRLRASGRVPAVLYGRGTEPVALHVDARALRAGLASAAGERVIFQLHVAGRQHSAILRELQRHPVRRTFAHLDLQIVDRAALDAVAEADAAIASAHAAAHAAVAAAVARDAARAEAAEAAEAPEVQGAEEAAGEGSGEAEG